ncbi:hypothetical protein Tco_1396617 [Tanacetum coccineum]
MTPHQQQKALDYENSGPVPQIQNHSSSLRTHDYNNEPLSSKLVPNVVPPADKIDSSQQYLSPTINSTQQQVTQPTANVQQPTTPTTTVIAEENNTDLQADDAQIDENEFINPFFTPVQEVVESSLRNVNTSNMHTVDKI